MLAAIASLLVLGAAPALAQEARPGPYAGLMFSQIGYDQSGASAQLTNLGVTLGQVLSPHFAVEARMGFGMDEDQITVASVPLDFELDYYFSGLLTGILPLAPRFAVYGLAGFTIGKFRASSPALFLDKWEADFSYGAGAEFGFLPSTSLSAEWQRMFEGPDHEVDAFSVALNFRF